ncbi:protein prenylyltransferase [Ramaria rubella]|nr:protein prenylyltransferase [Ramaria rubella]
MQVLASLKDELLVTWPSSYFFLLLTLNSVSIEVIPDLPEHELQPGESNPHHPLLVIHGNLGIPQSILFQAYIVANQQLSRLTTSNPALNQSRRLMELDSMTAILLIANPAHNTALNRRKLLIRTHAEQLNPHQEIRFIAALLGNKQTSKSSLLWHHRRWLFQEMYDIPTDREQSDLEGPLVNTPVPVNVLQAEFELVTGASEIYPRNYYAWLHRFFCAQCLISRATEGNRDAIEALFVELKSSQTWVELHASDHTAVHYLSRLVSMLQPLSISIEFPPCVPSACFYSPLPSESATMISHALSLVASYPTHESLWLYLRLACGMSSNRGPGDRWIVDLVVRLNQSDRSEEGAANLYTVGSFVERMLSQCRAENLPAITKSALHLLVWTLLLVRSPI